MTSIFKQVTNVPVNAIAATCHAIAFFATSFWTFDVGILFHLGLLLAGLAATFVARVRYYLRHRAVLDYGETSRAILAHQLVLSDQLETRRRIRRLEDERASLVRIANHYTGRK